MISTGSNDKTKSIDFEVRQTGIKPRSFLGPYVSGAYVNLMSQTFAILPAPYSASCNHATPCSTYEISGSTRLPLQRSYKRHFVG
jgi:hypothetical protein